MTRAKPGSLRLVPGLIAIAAVLLGGGGRARAHQQTTTYGVVSWTDGEVTWRLRVRAVDLAIALPAHAGATFGTPAWRARSLAYLSAGLAVFDGQQACPKGPARLDDEAGAVEPTLVFIQPFACPPEARALRLRYGLLFENDRFHESFTLLAGQLRDDAGAPSIVFRDGLRESGIAVQDTAPAASTWVSARVYLRLGVVHILTGYDHLAFLMGLLLAVGLRQRTRGGTVAAATSTREALRRILPIVTAFTVAHSLTLASQILRPGWIGTRWVEPAIAFSVAFVGIDNLVPRPPRWRFPLVFGFGLVHGLGFASALREIGLPRRGLLLSLVAFNAGVELGQLLILSMTLPIILGAARRSPRAFERWGLGLGSCLIACFGTIWLIARVARP
ncbi:MAG: HupE/UreJ family protein [Pseudomonadota bacterium]